MKHRRLIITFCMSAVCLLILVKFISSQTRVGNNSSSDTPIESQDGTAQDAIDKPTQVSKDLDVLNQCVPPPNTTMVAWYPFDEVNPPDTKTANLATGNIGTRMGSPLPLFLPGMVGNALNFNGLNSVVQSPSTIVTNIGPAGTPQTCGGGYSTCRGDLSIDAWINLAAPGSGTFTRTIVEKRTGTRRCDRGYGFYVTRTRPANVLTNKLVLTLADGIGAGFTNYVSVSIPTLFTGWHHVAVTVSRRATNGIVFYLDGGLLSVSNPLTSRRWGTLENTSPLRIGARLTTNTVLRSFFKGKIDELEIFNRVLDPVEVSGIYLAGPAGKCKTIKDPTSCALKVLYDFDGDGRPDVSVFRPSNATWYISNSSNGTVGIMQFGMAGDAIVPGDYDGDGITDFAVNRPSTSQWFILKSATNTITTVTFGSSGDVNVPSDYDGDGLTDVAVFRPSNGTWYIQRSSDGTVVNVSFGTSGDLPVPADYDGDSLADVAVFRPSVGVWEFLSSLDGSTVTTTFGQAGDKPVPADYDGDGLADLAVFTPSTGSWNIQPSTGDEDILQQFGTSGDKPVPADYDGDGLVDLAVWRPSTGFWYILNSSTGTLTSTPWGMAGDEPVPGAYIP